MVFFPYRTTIITFMENPITLNLLATEIILCTHRRNSKRQRNRGAGGVAQNTFTKGAFTSERMKVPLISSPDTKVLIKKALRALAITGVMHRACMQWWLVCWEQMLPFPLLLSEHRKLQSHSHLPAWASKALQLTEPLVQFSISEKGWWQGVYSQSLESTRSTELQYFCLCLFTDTNSHAHTELL